MKFQILVFLILNTFLTKVFSWDNTTIADLPEGIAAQLLSLLTNQTIELTGGCEELNENDVQLILFTRTNPEEPIILNSTNPNEIDPTKPIILLIHGWISNSDRFVPEMRDNYLQRYDCNVILVDWRNLAKKFYTTSVCYVPKIAEFIANFLCSLDFDELSFSDVRLVGHSLGGQMSGFIGQHTKNICNQSIGRITAMDPAGPLYQGLPTSQRLDNSDANFVDVIHTNGGILGYFRDCGHADFYVNCGTIQLGCPELMLTLAAIKDLPVSLVTCHHSRSIEYMAESVAVSDSFEAKECPKCPFTCLGSLIVRVGKILMGENINLAAASGGYAVTTNLFSPYSGRLLDSIKEIKGKIPFTG